MLAAALLTSWLLSRLLGRPLRGLAAAMERFERDADHFTYRPVGGTREVRELSSSFGHMVLRIQQLMSTVREEEVNLRKTELKALQAQINPHFLYNTLDSIAWMCEQGRNADAVNMVHALARLFRISISKGHELIPIAKEIEHAESYLQIQKYRYKNQFTYEFEVDPGCLDYYCNKITLQPIIENAINHGLDLMVDEGRITVEVLPGGGGHPLPGPGQRRGHEPGAGGRHLGAGPGGPHRHRHPECGRPAEDLFRSALRPAHHQRAGCGHLRGDPDAQGEGGGV